MSEVSGGGYSGGGYGGGYGGGFFSDRKAFIVFLILILLLLGDNL
ncbi:MAG: sporulation protein YjcZ [Bacillota bacterium]